ncbi:MAG: hydroxymethylglutaryl-CoA reductase, degradative [Bacteroidetes bacterium]|nr:hydroxymethylglutaryl-CoA reductase, degradative [Bacteroidota bacterium]
MKKNPVEGFSKYSKSAKLEWIIFNYFQNSENSLNLLKSYWHNDAEIQKLHDEFIENSLTNFYIPYGIAPNFLINNKLHCIPLAIEESSVVAASAKSANFWLNRGGFNSTVISTEKIGHIHFLWEGSDFYELQLFFNNTKSKLLQVTEQITAKMRARGGGITDLKLVNKTDIEPNYYQLEATFETCDSMGANFINTVLEEISKKLKLEIFESNLSSKNITVIMCILSNYSPRCLVKSEVQCEIKSLNFNKEINPNEFASKFKTAVRIAEIEPYRAVTHNKGIMNGIDAVAIATGNDFRAIEACAHAFASRNGKYSSLTHVDITDGMFKFWIEIPLSVGTVGGITSLHPMVKFSHHLLGNPGATQLMCIIAAAGLAQNFSALRSLVTSGIQKGHMKMHLLNILNQLEATEDEKAQIVEYFKDKVPTHYAAVEAFCKVRGIKDPSTLKIYL